MNNEDKFYKIFFEGPEAMVICRLDDKRIVDANKSYLKILGIESEIIDIKELNYTQTWLFTRDRDIFFKRIKVEGSMNDYQVPFEKRDGSIIYTSLSASIINEDNVKLVVIVIRDITETKRIEMKLVENEHFTESITHLTPDFLYISDLAMKKSIYSNKSILEYLGYDRSEFILDETKFLHTIINKDDIEINRELINKKHNDLKNGEKLEYSYRAKAKNGQDLWFLNTEVVFKYNAYNEPIQILGVVREITKQKEIEQRISYMLEFTTKIVESSTVGIVTFSENGDCIQANDAAINILGTTREFMLENNFNKIKAWKDSGIFEKAKKALKENITEEMSVNTITSFGKNIWLDIRLVPFLTQNEKNLLVLFSDITDRKKVEDAIIRSRKRAKDQFRAIPVPTYIWQIIDNKIFLIDYNDEADRTTNGEILSYLGEEHREMYKDREDIMEYFDICAQEKNTLQREIKYSLVGPERYFSIKFAYIEPDTILVHTVDITDLKENEAKLNDEKLSAQKANKMKTEFLANMSHEIRTPMNAIIGFAEILDPMIQDEMQKKYVESIKRAGKGLLKIINDILDLSKIEAGMMSIDIDKVKIRECINDIKQLFEQNLIEKGIELIVEIEKNIPEIILSDEIRLRQILLNLIGNAVKFTEKGYIKVTVKSLERENMNIDLSISVEDTGIGIADDQKELIFESFRQHEGQNSRIYGGTGLGLSITKRILNIMNGKIDVSSKIGEGSIFKVTLFNVKIENCEEKIDEYKEEKDLEEDKDRIKEIIDRHNEEKEDWNISEYRAFIEIFEKKYLMPLINSSQTLIMDEVEKLALNIKADAIKHNIKLWIDSAAKLNDYTSSFDVSKIKYTIDSMIKDFYSMKLALESSYKGLQNK